MAKKEEDKLPGLRAALKKKQFAPVYLFHGDEDFLIEEYVDLLLSGALEEGSKSFNFDVLWGGETEAKAIASNAAMFPMMAERRVVVVKEFEKLADKEELASYIEHPSPTTVLLLIAAATDFRLKIYKTLRENSYHFPRFREYDTRGVRSWIQQRFEERSRSISPEAVDLFLARSDRSLRELSNEIDKLILYAGERKKIEEDDVSEIVGISKENNVFALQNAVGEKNIGRAVAIMEELTGRGESPNGLVAGLASYIQKVWVLQEMVRQGKPNVEIASFLNLPPTFNSAIEGYTQAARKYSGEELEHACMALEETDILLKSSGGDKNIAMTTLLFRIIHSGTPIAKS
ncbi:MAG TPA: DNA polymerase III subunit delta [Bacteroidota bacterium]|nr:DNA polymerase III subunit delta [Bacteroidota bacterium]